MYLVAGSVIGANDYRPSSYGVYVSSSESNEINFGSNVDNIHTEGFHTGALFNAIGINVSNVFSFNNLGNGMTIYSRRSTFTNLHSEKNGTDLTKTTRQRAGYNIGPRGCVFNKLESGNDLTQETQSCAIYFDDITRDVVFNGASIFDIYGVPDPMFAHDVGSDILTNGLAYGIYFDKRFRARGGVSQELPIALDTPKVIALFNSSGTLLLGENCTVSNVGVGRFLITFDDDFLNTNYLISGTVRAYNTGARKLDAEVRSSGSVVVLIRDTTNDDKTNSFLDTSVVMYGTTVQRIKE